MDFIERLFGFAPDNGSGFIEYLVLAIPLAVAILTPIARRCLRITRRQLAERGRWEVLPRSHV